MGFFELMARWRYLRQGQQRQESDARWQAHVGSGSAIEVRGLRSRGEH